MQSRTFASGRPRAAAFSIMEVMMAVAVMALVLGSSILVMRRAFALQDSARNIATAAQVMQSEMEKMRLKDWTTVSAYAAGPTVMTVDSAFTTMVGIGNRFTLRRSVSTPQTDMRRVVLTVSWLSYDGRTVSRSLETFYSRYGLYDYYFNQAGS